MTESQRLKGKVALVTGAGNGMGRAMAQRFAAEGAIVFGGDIDDSCKDGLEADGCSYVKLDVTQEASWADAMGAINAAAGRLDIVVNNAGIIINKTIEEVDLESWDRVIAVNLTGVMLGCKFAIAAMKDNPGGPGGSIINISSSTAFAAHPDIAYTSAKSGLRMLSRSVAVQAGRKYGIRCNALAPGIIVTAMTQKSFSEKPRLREHFEGLSPLHKIGSGDDIASMAVYLASDESGFVTGSDFHVDGGSLAAHPGF
ncbi:SDR family NAD(P)-dependent oxidoreductase [Sphingobium sp.]|uniref:SDR family NAD(P)-dependent oxidoreductase n=1 Tax=Sphingobium sp. TaxID=1912891 RepID=UPI003BB77E7F